MEKSFEQLHLGDMEHGLTLPVAVIAMRPEEIAVKSGIKFEVSRDDLDYLKAALIRVSSGHQYALVSHQHASYSGTDLLMNERRSDIGFAIDEVTQALDISSDNLSWIHPDVH